MQMKRFISIILSAALLIPIISIAASAYESSYSGEESDKTLKGTIKFDGGDGWDNKTVLFYIWDSTTKERATKDGWVYEDCWGSAKKIGGTLVDGETTVYESYEFDLSGREDHDVFVIFHNRDTGEQTMNCLINETVFGKTARRSGIMYENPVDSEKSAEGVEFNGGTGIGIEKLITSSGKIQGDIIPHEKTPEEIVAKFILNYLYKSDKITGERIVTRKSVAKAIASFGTTQEDVWAEYQTYSDDFAYDEEGAEEVIFGTGDPDPVFNILGDVDGDGMITSADSLYILRRSVDLEAMDAVIDSLADVDGDGEVMSDDALEVLRVSVQLPSDYPIGSVIS